MNKSYTEKYLIQDISNKAFRSKYGASKPKKRRLFKYGWSTTGVDDSNRKKWQDVILRQNPWMSNPLFIEPPEDYDPNSLESKHLRSIGEELRE